MYPFRPGSVPDLLREMNCQHQQYLYRNPNGYCRLGGTGVACPMGLTSGDA